MGGFNLNERAQVYKNSVTDLENQIFDFVAGKINLTDFKDKRTKLIEDINKIPKFIFGKFITQKS